MEHKPRTLMKEVAKLLIDEMINRERLFLVDIKQDNPELFHARLTEYAEATGRSLEEMTYSNTSVHDIAVYEVNQMITSEGFGLEHYLNEIKDTIVETWEQQR